MYAKGAKRRNSLPMQYCTLGSIKLRHVDHSKFVSYSLFVILIEYNKSTKAKSSLRSTIRKFKFSKKLNPPEVSHETSMDRQTL